MYILAFIVVSFIFYQLKKKENQFLEITKSELRLKVTRWSHNSYSNSNKATKKSEFIQLFSATRGRL